MKLTKDRVNNPLPNVDIQKIVDNLATLSLTHIAISVPMDYPNYALEWTTRAHNKGLKVLHRGTWNQIEGLYGQPKLVGSSRPPDTINFWLNKTTKYITDNPNLFADGDLWGPIPERTEGIFQDATSFLPYDGTGIQTNYTTFFNSLVDQSKAAFQIIGKNVLCGFTANNFTEIDSGWIQQGVFDKAQNLSVDHYVSPDLIEADLKRINQKKNLAVFHQEWGTVDPTWDINTAVNAWRNLINANILIGINYWGGWPGNNESILNTDYTVNDKGRILGEFFKSIVSPQPVPEPLPISIPEQFVQVYGTSIIVGLSNKGNLYKRNSITGEWTKVKLPTF